MQKRLRISIRGQTTWNKFVANTEKELESSSLLKAKVRILVDLENQTTFF